MPSFFSLSVLLALTACCSTSAWARSRRTRADENGQPSTDRLVLYAYSRNDPEYERNLHFFVEHGIGQASACCRFLIVVQDLEHREEEVATLPALPGNAEYLFHDNECFDWGTYGWVLSRPDLDTSLYNFFIFINSSVRGPFLPPYWPKHVHWTDAFVAQLNNKVKLTGSTISCEAPLIGGNSSSERRDNPHVQSYLLATDKVGLALLRADPHIFGCHRDIYDAVYWSEMGASLAVLQAGHTIDCLMARYQGIDWHDARNHECNARLNPYDDGSSDGQPLNPLEVLFVKVKDFMLQSRWASATAAAAYDRWITDKGIIGSINSNALTARNQDRIARQALLSLNGPHCFDRAFYKAHNRLADGDDADTWEHYVKYGSSEGRRARFTCRGRTLDPDVASVVMDAHFNHTYVHTPDKTQLPSTSSRCGGSRIETSCVAIPAKPPAAKKAKRTKVEILKERSDYLRHPLMEELVSEASNINEEAGQLMKFHGSYQQDDRDKRTQGQGKFYQFMMRTRQPAGLVSNQLYLTMDDLANQYGNGTLRLTTRQTYQLHGVLKGDLKTVFSSVIKAMGTTLGACGDVNRNVIAPSAPFKDRPEYAHAEVLAVQLADLLAPQSGAYYDIWLDGEKFVSSTFENPAVTAARDFNGFGTNYPNSPEPIYGSHFLPRKFKIAVTVPGDNSVDLFTNDLGIVVISDSAGEVLGYDILVGGGMGRSHRNDATFPRLADPLGYVAKADIFHAVKAIVATQRDYGRRDDRKQARLKYLVDEWGVPKFRSVVEQYLGKKFEPFRPLPAWEYKDYLGWMEQGDGRLAYGVYVQNGRLKNEAKKALRTIIERYELPVRLTVNQNLILTEIEPMWKNDILDTLVKAGVRDVVDVEGFDRLSMACPALPLCGLAISEAERGLPDVNRRLRALLDSLGFDATDQFVVRMTGCPNGCARPYMAELGFVGDGPNSYQLWLGGCPNQTRLAQVFQERMKIQDMEKTLKPLLAYFKGQRRPDEPFGDFCARVGFGALRDYAAGYIPAEEAAELPKVGLKADVFAKLEAKAKKSGKSLEHTLSDALRSFA